MKKIHVRKEEQEGTVRITYRFKSFGQFLLEDDPTPLPEKELTDEAEEAISGHLDEFPVSKPASLVIELPAQDLERVAAAEITGSIRHHFGFRQVDLTHDLTIAWREGLYSLILMVANICLLLAFAGYLMLYEIPIESVKVAIIVGFLTIMNWATIWDSYEHFLYDYRNLARKRRIYRKVTELPITVVGY